MGEALLHDFVEDHGEGDLEAGLMEVGAKPLGLVDDASGVFEPDLEAADDDVVGD